MRIRVFAGACFALLIAAHPHGAEAAACSQAEIGRAAEETELARKMLIALPVGDGLQTDVSPAAQQAIAMMQTRLGALVDAYMRCAAPEGDETTLERELSRLTHGIAAKPGANPDDAGHYGSALRFAVKRSPDHPQLLGVAEHFAIEC